MKFTPGVILDVFKAILAARGLVNRCENSRGSSTLDDCIAGCAMWLSTVSVVLVFHQLNTLPFSSGRALRPSG